MPDAGMEAHPTQSFMTDPNEPHAGLGLERLIFFSDAVFAIAITLLVLDIRIPEIPAGLEVTELPKAMAAVSTNIIAYLISFIVIATFWVSHHDIFELVRFYNRRLLWLNLILLLFIAFSPFPTSIMAHYGNTAFAFTLYAANQVAISTMLTVIWVYATQNHRLVDPDLPRSLIRYRFYRGLMLALFFALSIPVAYLIGPMWAFVVWVLPALARGLLRRAGDRPGRLRGRVEAALFGQK